MVHKTVYFCKEIVDHATGSLHDSCASDSLYKYSHCLCFKFLKYNSWGSLQSLYKSLAFEVLQF